MKTQTSQTYVELVNQSGVHMKSSSASGFTLIELLVVMAIIGILAAIAVPQFTMYQRRGGDAMAKSDLHNVITAEEAYFVDNGQYLACQDAACVCVPNAADPTICDAGLPGIKALSSGTTVNVTLVGTNDFNVTSSNSKGTGVVFSWVNGQLLKDGNPI